MESDKNLTLFFDERDKIIKDLIIDSEKDEQDEKVVITFKKPKRVEINEYVEKYKLGKNYVTMKGICKLRHKTFNKMKEEIYEYELKNNIKGGLFF